MTVIAKSEATKQSRLRLARATGSTLLCRCASRNDKDGKKHDWRNDLFNALKKRQKPDGSWSNDKSEMFFENNADLATSYAILALSYCKPAKK